MTDKKEKPKTKLIFPVKLLLFLAVFHIVLSSTTIDEDIGKALAFFVVSMMSICVAIIIHKSNLKMWG